MVRKHILRLTLRWDSTIQAIPALPKPDRRETLPFGSAIQRNIGSEFVEHNRDGRISRKDSHGNDPCPPRG